MSNQTRFLKKVTLPGADQRGKNAYCPKGALQNTCTDALLYLLFYQRADDLAGRIADERLRPYDKAADLPVARFSGIDLREKSFVVFLRGTGFLLGEDLHRQVVVLLIDDRLSNSRISQEFVFQFLRRDVLTGRSGTSRPSWLPPSRHDPYNSPA